MLPAARRPALALILATGLAACAGAPQEARAPGPVDIVAIPAARPELEPLAGADDEPEPSPRARCVIKGGGERVGALRDAPPFDVFTAKTGPAPALRIVASRMVEVRWSDLPRVGSGRARVAIGGQRLVRMQGWAELAGRAFQVRRRAEARAGHVWVRGGSAVEILGVEGGSIRVRADLAFESPRQLDAVTSCDNLVYEPGALPRPEDEKLPAGAQAFPTGQRLDLHAEPGGPALLGIDLEGISRQELVWLEARDGFARVAGEREDLAFDAWVPEAQVVRPRGRSYRLSGRSIGCGIRVERPEPARVKEDAALRVGAEPGGPVIGIVEAGARIHLGEERGDLVAFSFEKREIEAPEGQRMWIARAAVTPP